MKGYAEREVFTARQMKLWRRAVELVERVPGVVSPSTQARWNMADRYVRCHELARAAGRILGLEVADGWYGFVEHSWLWTQPPDRIDGQMLGPLPDILDVYLPGHLPQVQLIHMYSSLLQQYRPSAPRTDVNERVVDGLEHLMRTGRRKRS